MTTTDTARDLLLDGFGRIRDGVPEVDDGLSVDELLWRPDAEANHIAWLVWHLARQQDDQVAHLVGEQSAWLGDGWVADPGLFGDYHAAVHDRTAALVQGLDAEGYERVVDAHWDPPVTVAVRIVSVLDDAAKHLGQAEYVKGLVERRR